MSVNLTTWRKKTFGDRLNKVSPYAQMDAVVGQVRYGHLSDDDGRALLAAMGIKGGTIYDRIDQASLERTSDIQNSIDSGDTSKLDKRYNQQFLESQLPPSIVPKTDTPAPVADEFKKTPEMIEWEDIVNAKIAKVPEFTPEMVSQWAPMLQEAGKPFEQESVKGLNEQFNQLSPYSYGSGGQLKATADMLTKFATNRMTQALALGQADFGRQSDEYARALTQKGELAAASSENEWKTLARKWAKEDAGLARKYSLEDQKTTQDWYTKLAESYKPAEKQWWEYIVEPVAAGFGGAAGQAGYNVLSDWLKPK